MDDSLKTQVLGHMQQFVKTPDQQQWLEYVGGQSNEQMMALVKTAVQIMPIEMVESQLGAMLGMDDDQIKVVMPRVRELYNILNVNKQTP